MGEIKDIVGRVMAGRSPVPEMPEEIKVAFMMMSAATEKVQELDTENRALKAENERLQQSVDALTAERDQLVVAAARARTMP